MNNLLIVSASAKDDFKQSALFKSLLKLYNPDPNEYIVPLGNKASTPHGTTRYEFGQLAKPSGFKATVINYPNNKDLPRAYNSAIRYAIDSPHDGLPYHDYVLFVHDDVSIEDGMLHRKIEDSLEMFDVVGLAGGHEVKLAPPALWHIMSQQRSGNVGHTMQDQTWTTNFGPVPQRVVILDGLFLASKTETFEKNDNLRFDEDLPNGGFHLYDLDFTMNAHTMDLKCGTYPIWVVHGSPGLTEFTEGFNNCQAHFLDKWNK